MQREEFLKAVLRNPTNRAILERLPALGLADAWLVSGAVFQTVWNYLTGRPPDYGIKDYDIFYFDPDTSWDAEDAAVRRTVAAFADTRIEVRNQARVHLWYAQKFGTAYEPLRCATDGIDRFLTPAAQIGIRPARDGYDIYAPSGLDDLANMTIRPNAVPNFQPDFYAAKAARWKERWPELSILPPPGERPASR